MDLRRRHDGQLSIIEHWLDEFESALRQDAAFVPASLDRRPDTMRVVFAVQKVDVDDRNF